MAIIIFDENGNAIGLSGRMGNVVYRFNKSTGKTIRCSPPRKSNGPKTDKQLEARKTFQEAVAYARNVCNNPKEYLAIKKSLPPGKTVWGESVAKYIREKKKVPVHPEPSTFLKSLTKLLKG